jgi:hypothetical protein
MLCPMLSAVSAINRPEQLQQKNLFDYIGGLCEQHRRQLEAEGLGSF